MFYSISDKKRHLLFIGVGALKFAHGLLVTFIINQPFVLLDEFHRSEQSCFFFLWNQRKPLFVLFHTTLLADFMTFASRKRPKDVIFL